jgi:hypothetical protein
MYWRMISGMLMRNAAEKFCIAIISSFSRDCSSSSSRSVKASTEPAL